MDKNKRMHNELCNEVTDPDKKIKMNDVLEVKSSNLNEENSTSSEVACLDSNMQIQSSDEECQDNFSLLPDEIILNIFKYFSNSTVIQKYFACVCHRWKELSSSPCLWQEVCLAGLKLDFIKFETLFKLGVKALYLNYTSITEFCPKFSDEAKSLCNLRILDLDYTTLTSNQLQELLSVCFYLEDLSLEHQCINVEICRCIAQNKDLKKLNLTGVEGFNYLSAIAIFEGCKKLEYLDLSNALLTKEDIDATSQAIPSSVKMLSLSGQSLLRNKHLQEIIKICSDLNELNISYCKNLKSSIVYDIISGLMNIKILDIDYNGFDYETEKLARSIWSG